MNHVEIPRPLGDSFEQQGAGSVRIGPLPAQTERAGPYWVKLAACPGIAAREERDVVAELDQFVNQPGDYPLGAAVEFRRDAFGQGSELSDTHRGCPLVEVRAQHDHDDCGSEEGNGVQALSAATRRMMSHPPQHSSSGSHLRYAMP
jgi:hypothetical protein